MSDIPRKSVETLGLRILMQAAIVVAGVITARSLGPYGRGIFAYVSNVFFLFITFNIGQVAAISWQYGRLKRPSGEVLAAMLRILTFGGIPAALLVAVLGLVLRGQLPLIAVACALPFAFYSQMANAFYLADGKVRTQNIQNLIRSVGFLVGLVPVLIIFHLGIPGMLVVFVISYVASAIYAAFMLRPYATAGNPAEVRSHVKEQAVFGIKASANSLMQLLNFNVDVYIILFILGPKALGIYSIAVGAGQVMWQLTQPLALSAFGQINSASRAESVALTAKCARHSMVLVGGGCVLLFLLGPWLINVLYGAPFREASGVLRLLLPGIAAYSMVPFFSTFFSQQLGKPLVPFTILSISTAVCALITWASIHRLGITAGAIGTSTSYFVALIVSIIFFLRESGISAKLLFGFTREDVRPYVALLGSLLKRGSRVAPENPQ